MKKGVEIQWRDGDGTAMKEIKAAFGDTCPRMTWNNNGTLWVQTREQERWVLVVESALTEEEKRMFEDLARMRFGS